ncbi:ribosome silencing factor [Lachnospira multipara]|uniref:ribosome silencing factor n=1 Tax=Lachnospira multipara TaxID=28051 RepID=UPI00047F6058|nr:ribosome silencing factor [Lachnospira multipara]
MNSNPKEMAKIALDALLDKKGEDVRVIDISEVSTIADFFVIASGSNINQVQALVDNVEEQMHKAGYVDPKIEGHGSSTWVLMDYEDIIVHVFSEEDRSFYNLERIWKDGKEIEL